jgi:hypothetical protein
MNAPTELRHLLCEQWCADADIAADGQAVRVSLPMYENDGDGITVWIENTLGGWRITDRGTTLMRLSYHMDIDQLSEGQRGKVFDGILSAQGIRNEEGELVLEAPEAQLGRALLDYGRAALQVGDIKLWSRSRVASTFYDDLAQVLRGIVGPDRLKRDYIVPNVPNAAQYPVDFCVAPDAPRPLFVFGVPNRDKARLATIVLQYLQQHGVDFESLVVPSELEAIPRADFRRLLNAANDMVDSIHAHEDLARKVRHRIAA